MQVQSVEVGEGDSPGRLRIQARVKYEGDGHGELLWFELPASLAAEVSTSGNPWLVALLPIAVWLQEPLRLPVPVDPVLLENCRAIMGVWHSWYRKRPPITIEADVRDAPAFSNARGTGLFFSGGVDSFYSLIPGASGGKGTHSRVTDLLLVHGADIPVSDSESFARLLPRMAEVARAFDAGIVGIATNLRATRWGRADWAHLSHGALLVASGLFLEPRLSQLIISSSAPHYRLRPYGSHPATDPLFSTARTKVVHHGAEVDRPEKIKAIAFHPEVVRHLRVCWLAKTDTNCGRCPKCLHTMIGLELFGALTRSECLPTKIDPAHFEGLYLERRGTYTAYAMMERFRPIALETGRRDLVQLIDRILSRSERKRMVKEGIEALGKLRLISSDTQKRLLARLFAQSVKY